MRWIYISPHMDDAVLSAGGLIHEQVQKGLAVEVWTIMAGGFSRAGEKSGQGLSDFARQMHTKWGTTTARQTVQLRWKEDRRAATIVGAKLVHLSFLDAIYRRASDGAWLYADPVGAAVHPDDRALPSRIAKKVGKKLLPEDMLVCPLGIGDHVDHILTRMAIESLGRTLQYTADIPYVLLHPEELNLKTASLRSSLHAVSEASLAAWLDAMAAYGSQLSTLFESWELLCEAVRSYCSAEGGIRLWSWETPSASLPLTP